MGRYIDRERETIEAANRRRARRDQIAAALGTLTTAELRAYRDHLIAGGKTPIAEWRDATCENRNTTS
jgi:hypothetical protein